MSREELLLFGERIRAARNACGFTQEQLADEAGITLRFYQMIERGEKSVSLDTLIRLGKKLNTSIDYLLFGSTPSDLRNPITDIYKQLSPLRRNDATKILQLYLQACNDTQ